MDNLNEKLLDLKDEKLEDMQLSLKEMMIDHISLLSNHYALMRGVIASFGSDVSNDSLDSLEFKFMAKLKPVTGAIKWLSPGDKKELQQNIDAFLSQIKSSPDKMM